jgi:hypothetical protein
MGFNPSIRTEMTVVDDDKKWLRTTKGWNTTQSITLDMSAFTGAIFADGAGAVEGRVLHSGVPLGRITASGLYGPYDNNQTDGTEVLAGYLFGAVELDNDTPASATNVAGALLWEGEVIQDRTPVHGVGADNDPGFLDDTTRDAYVHIRFLQSSDLEEQGDSGLGFAV